MNICTEFGEPMLILCQDIWTRFGLYTIKLKTLNFDGLISKSIGIIYTPRTNVCAKFDKPRSILCLVNMQTRSGLYIRVMTVTVTLTFDKLTSKSIRIIYAHTHVCTKFDKRRSILCLVIYTMFGLYINMLMVTVTLTLDRLISKSVGIIYTPRQMSIKFDETMSIPCLLIILTRFRLYTNMSTISVTLTLNRLISKSIGIIYTPLQISVPNLRNLSHFCV